MAYDEQLGKRVRGYLSPFSVVTERKMFGGLAFLLQGNMCCGVVGEELMVRVGRDGYEAALREPHAREMDFTGRPLRGFIYVASKGLVSDGDLRSWVERGARFAKTLPAKTRVRE
jgi:TfoX/Sxy family transcriptional regulator of competence genes